MASPDKKEIIGQGPMKIGLFLNARPTDGGAFQYSRSILEAVASLPKTHFAPLTVYTNKDWVGPVSEQDIPALYSSPGLWGLLARKRISGYLPLTWWRRWCPSFQPMIKTLNNQSCDLWIFPSQDTWTYLFPFPSIGTIYDLMHRYERHFPEVGSRGIYKSREQHYKRICLFAKKIFADSAVGKRHIIESYGISPEKIHILPFAASRQTTADTGIISSYKLPEKFIFYPAQFWKHKNHKALIDALHLLRHTLPDLKLVFVGSKKNNYINLSKHIMQLDLSDHVRFLGYIPDEAMPVLYNRARAFIMPTFFGPTNIPPLEAMAEGCPVAVSDIYGMREQLGEAALYFNPSSTLDIALAIRTIWTDDGLCRKLSQRGFQHHRQWNQNHFNDRLRIILETITHEDNSNP